MAGPRPLRKGTTHMHAHTKVGQRGSLALEKNQLMQFSGIGDTRAPAC